ncbi:MAG: lipopolysaccharide heptosyltransferase I [Pyrinomonadaceae bacterium]
MRLLFVKLGSIGDIVHTLPALAAVRNSCPDAEISWVVEERSAEILRNNPFIENLIEVDTKSLRGRGIIDGVLMDATRQVKDLRQFDFDVTIDFQGLIKSGLISRLSGAPRRIGFARTALRESSARVFYTESVEVGERVHVIKKNLALVEGALGIKCPENHLEFPIHTSAEHRTEAAEIIGRAGGDFAVLNPAGGWVTKLWHPEKFGGLADRLWREKRITSVIATATGEMELAERAVVARTTGHIVLAQPSLKGFYELVKHAAVYVGGDTGPTHLAVAAGAPVVGLFGPTEWWRNGSLNPDDICVEREDIGCRVACHRRTCTNWICMDSDVDVVYDAVDARMQRVSSLVDTIKV